MSNSGSLRRIFALPQDVQDETAKDCGPNERPKWVYHKGVAYLVADAHGSTVEMEADDSARGSPNVGCGGQSHS